MVVERRQEVVHSQGICLNCLYPGHYSNQCKSSFTCRHCSQKHHTMLHKNSTPAVTAASTSTTNVIVASTGNVGVPTILSTAKVAVTNGRLTQVTRALLDDGSVTSFISEQLANTLRLHRTSCQRSFTGATCNLLECRSQVTVSLNIPGPAVTEPIAVVCYMVQQLKWTRPYSAGCWVVSCTAHLPARLYCPYSQLDKALERLYQLEAEPERKSLTQDEVRALDDFWDNHHRLPEGRFCVRLPRKETPPVLGESRQTAIRRFLSNESSLRRKGKLGDFEQVLQEYLDLGHAEVVPEDQLTNKPSYYLLPVHGVIKETSTSTKSRAVFDASCSTSTGISLNDILLPGPNVYPPITSVINKFRLPLIIFSADIRKMFREVMLQAGDSDLHRFIYRNQGGKLTDCRMLKLTFGVTCFPFLATKVLHQLDNEVAKYQPELSQVVRSQLYVDDCLTGADTVAAAAAISSSF